MIRWPSLVDKERMKELFVITLMFLFTITTTTTTTTAAAAVAVASATLDNTGWYICCWRVVLRGRHSIPFCMT